MSSAVMVSHNSSIIVAIVKVVAVVEFQIISIQISLKNTPFMYSCH